MIDRATTCIAGFVFLCIIFFLLGLYVIFGNARNMGDRGDIKLIIQADNIEIIEDEPKNVKIFSVVYSERFSGFLLVLPHGWMRIENIEVVEASRTPCVKESEIKQAPIGHYWSYQDNTIRKEFYK